MLYLGILIALGAAGAFLTMGGLSVFGSADATKHEVERTFVPDPPAPGERVLTYLGLWVPVIVVAFFCLLTAIQIVRVVGAALR